jgi:hypothetical protein
MSDTAAVTNAVIEPVLLQRSKVTKLEMLQEWAGADKTVMVTYRVTFENGYVGYTFAPKVSGPPVEETKEYNFNLQPIAKGSLTGQYKVEFLMDAAGGLGAVHRDLVHVRLESLRTAINMLSVSVPYEKLQEYENNMGAFFKRAELIARSIEAHVLREPTK